MTIEIRQVSSPTETKGFNTDQLRENYLVQEIFVADQVTMTYSHLDRSVVGGATPTTRTLKLEANKQIGTKRFLDRREIGIINVGNDGIVIADGIEYPLNYTDCLYLPMGVNEVNFRSIDAQNPANFYFVSTPAHHAYAAKIITANDAILLELGSQSDCNKRNLRQYIHPEVVDSCQLVMGVTTIEDGSVWNTMPCHIHDRRSEIYLYFDMKADTRVIHLMGEPDETRHLIVKNQEAILSPGWSIHSGAGTGRYAFIWSMAGDNQDFTDMDFINMQDLR